MISELNLFISFKLSLLKVNYMWSYFLQKLKLSNYNKSFFIQTVPLFRPKYGICKLFDLRH